MKRSNVISILIILIILVFCEGTSLYGQTKKWRVDTVSINKKKTGIRFGIYKRLWFPRDGRFSYHGSKVNKQDSFVLYRDTSVKHYFKVYNSRGKLLFEGKQGDYEEELSGNIKFYRRNRKLKKIEVWKSNYFIDSLGMRFEFSDGTEHVETKHFRQNGTIKKTFLLTVKINSKEPSNSFWIYRTTYYAKTGKAKRIKEKKP